MKPCLRGNITTIHAIDVVGNQRNKREKLNIYAGVEAHLQKCLGSDRFLAKYYCLALHSFTERSRV